MAVTYATSTMGADHTAGFVVEQNLEEFGGTLDRFSAKGQVETSRKAQIHMAAVDTMGICDFAQTGFGAPDGLSNVCKMIAAKLGKNFEVADWTNLGIRILKAERSFNRNAGFTNKDDRLPKMFYKEPLPPHNTVVIISDEELDKTFDF
jgi:aldehyde:ferredoxin oxidoreductase